MYTDKAKRIELTNKSRDLPEKWRKLGSARSCVLLLKMTSLVEGTTIVDNSIAMAMRNARNKLVPSANAEKEEEGKAGVLSMLKFNKTDFYVARLKNYYLFNGLYYSHIFFKKLGNFFFNIM